MGEEFTALVTTVDNITHKGPTPFAIEFKIIELLRKDDRITRGHQVIFGASHAVSERKNTFRSK